MQKLGRTNDILFGMVIMTEYPLSRVFIVIPDGADALLYLDSTSHGESDP